MEKAKAGSKDYRLYEGKGLTTKGGEWWCFKSTFDDKENNLPFGTSPYISLAEARDKRQEARKKLQNGLILAMYARRKKEHRLNKITLLK